MCHWKPQSWEMQRGRRKMAKTWWSSPNCFHPEKSGSCFLMPGPKKGAIGHFDPSCLLAQDRRGAWCIGPAIGATEVYAKCFTVEEETGWFPRSHACDPLSRESSRVLQGHVLLLVSLWFPFGFLLVSFCSLFRDF